jgi:hypothetical protein
MAALPPVATPTAPPASPRADEAIRALIGGIGRVNAERAAKLEAERQRARAEAIRAHKERVAATRATLAPRIHPRLLAALKARPSPCALLLGPTRVGKTSAARWLEAGMRGGWCYAREIAGCERHYPLGEGSPPAFERAASASVLYLDDLGTEDARDVAVIQHLLERRYSAQRPVVITTGLTRPQLTDRYGAATVRRLTDQHVPRKDGTQWPVLVVDLHEGGAQ